ncbi:MAG: HAD-IB family hydrolase [Deferribacteres bacterium]|nr:HAD-IB family hydrolase [Deferribacteres bacterium]
MKRENTSSVGAFFDVDKTITDSNTMTSFYWYYYRNRRRPDLPVIASLAKSRDMTAAFVKFIWCLAHSLKDDDRVAVNKKYYACLRGINTEEYHKLAEQWYFSEKIASTYNTRVIERLKEHQSQKHTVVLVSGSHTPLIRPLGDELGVDSIIATEVETSGGRFTGRILNEEPLVGAGKANAIRSFAERHGIDLSQSYAYSDHYSDVKMLETVGNPSAVIGDRRLREYAQARGWDMIIL